MSNVSDLAEFGPLHRDSMATESLMYAVNRRAYDSLAAAQAYSRGDELSLPERTVLARLSPQLQGGKLLDLGVGAGRTTPALLRISRNYTGLDYSPRLAELAKRRTGVRTIYCGDACDMRDLFEDERFDFALFSFNGIDYMPHDSRIAALAEIHRVLRPGGWFFFSSHNRAAINKRARAIGLKAQLKKVAFLPRHWRLRRLESETAEYAVLNDSGLRYSLLTYYIEVSAQIAQLTAVDFDFVAAYDTSGLPVAEDLESPFIHYLATKTKSR